MRRLARIALALALALTPAGSALSPPPARAESPVGGSGRPPAKADVVNVLAPGHGLTPAKGDGTTDDAPALQAILDARPGGTIYLPRTAGPADDAVSYYCGATLHLTHPGTTLKGDGGGWMGGTQVKFAAKVTGVSVEASGCVVSDLLLSGSEPWHGTFYDEGVVPAHEYSRLSEADGGSAADGVRLWRTFIHLKDLTIRNFGRHGVSSAGSQLLMPVSFGGEDTLCERVNVTNCRGSGVKAQGGDSNCQQWDALACLVNQVWGVDYSPLTGGVFNSTNTTQNGYDGSWAAGATEDQYGAAVAGLTRSGGVATLTWSAAYTNPVLAAGPTAGVTVLSSPNNASFAGSWRLLSVAPDNLSLTFRNPGPDVTTPVAGATARGTYLPGDVPIVSVARAQTPAVTATGGAVTNGSATITGLSTTAGVWTGMAVSGPNVPAGALVYSVDSASQVRLTATAGGTAAGATLTFTDAAAVVTITLSQPLQTPATSDGHFLTVNNPIVPGQGVTLADCPDASFNTTLVALRVSADHKTITCKQVGVNATVTAGNARLALPFETWKGAGLATGDIQSLASGATQWNNPYVEGGGKVRMNPNALLITPLFGANFTVYSDGMVDNDGVWSGGMPSILTSNTGGLGGLGVNSPLNVVWPVDSNRVSRTVIGATAAQLHQDLFCSPLLTNGSPTPIWNQQRSGTNWEFGHGDNSQPGYEPLLRFLLGSGFTYLNSMGAGMVRINADAATGTGGLLVGDGTGGGSATTIVGGRVAATGLVTGSNLPAPTGDATKFLRADGTFAVPAGGTGGGSAGAAGQLQKADGAGGFAAVGGVTVDTDGSVTAYNSVASAAVRIGKAPGDAGTGGLWIGQGTPDTTNYAVAGATADTLVNATNTLHLRARNLDTFLVDYNAGVPRLIAGYQATAAMGDTAALASFVAPAAATKGLIVQAAASQTANLLEAQPAGSHTATFFVRPDGSVGLPSLADSAAANNSLYWSSTTSKLTYKDPAGVLHAF